LFPTHAAAEYVGAHEHSCGVGAAVKPRGVGSGVGRAVGSGVGAGVGRGVGKPRQQPQPSIPQ
jgi:hypothetical protein